MLRLWLFSALTALESRDRPLPPAYTRQPWRLCTRVEESTALSACCGVLHRQPMQNAKTTESLVGSTSQVAKVLLLPCITFEPGCRIEWLKILLMAGCEESHFVALHHLWTVFASKIRLRNLSQITRPRRGRVEASGVFWWLENMLTWLVGKKNEDQSSWQPLRGAASHRDYTPWSLILWSRHPCRLNHQFIGPR
jgi:hypothetical protein